MSLNQWSSHLPGGGIPWDRGPGKGYTSSCIKGGEKDQDTRTHTCTHTHTHQRACCTGSQVTIRQSASTTALLTFQITSLSIWGKGPVQWRVFHSSPGLYPGSYHATPIPTGIWSGGFKVQTGRTEPFTWGPEDFYYRLGQN